MNYPSAEFGDAVSRLCDARATDEETQALHDLLQSSPAARDAYLWQVELHGRLAQLAAAPQVPPAMGGTQRPPRRLLPPVRSARLQFAAVALVILTGALALWIATHPRENPRKSVSVLPPSHASTGPSSATSLNSANSLGGTQNEGVYRETVRFAIAADASVIVGTGSAEPVRLGAEVPYEKGGNTLNIWDWSKSPLSRVMKDLRLWPQDRFAVSPDGKWLVLASGKVIDLSTGAQSTIDLGGEFYFDDIGGHLRRIQDLQFTPDGRLALRICRIALTPSTHPLLKEDFNTKRTIQIVTFPTGKLVCEFDAGLALQFSHDGRRAVTSVPEHEEHQQIIERDAATGAITRKFEPRLRGFAYAIDFSPDASRLAVFESAGDLMIWDTASGELKRRVHVKEETTRYLRFSPDGKLIAISLIGKTSVFDAASGAMVAKFPQESPGYVRWAADSRSLEIVSNVASVGLSEGKDEAGQEILYNMFPAVTEWKLPGK